MEPAEVVHRLGEAAKSSALRRGRHEGWARYPAPQTLIVPMPGLRERVRDGGRRRCAPPSPPRRATTLAGRFSALGLRLARAGTRLRCSPKPLAARPGDRWALARRRDLRAWTSISAMTASRGDIKHVREINRLQLLVPLAAEALLDDNAGAACRHRSRHCQLARRQPALPRRRLGLGHRGGAARHRPRRWCSSLVGHRLSREATRQLGEILAASALLAAALSLKVLLGQQPPRRGADGRMPHRASPIGQPVRRAEAGARRRNLPPDLAGRRAGRADPDLWRLHRRDGCCSPPISAQATSAPFPAGCARPAQRLRRLHHRARRHCPSLGRRRRRPGADAGRRRDRLCRPRSRSAITGFLGRSGPAATPELRGLIFEPATEDGDRNARASPPSPHGGLSVWHGRPTGPRRALDASITARSVISPIAAHGHADALALTLSLDGQPVLVDPGTVSLRLGRRLAQLVPLHPGAQHAEPRGRAARAAMSGAFNWSHKARARLEESGERQRPVAAHEP